MLNKTHKTLALLIESNSAICNFVYNREGLTLTKPITDNTNNKDDSEVFKKNLVKDFNDLKNNFFV